AVPVMKSARALYQQTVLPLEMSRRDLDVFFATATVAPLLTNVSTVLSVQFTQFYEWPHAYGTWRTAYLRRMLPLSLAKARKVITFTETAKSDLVRFTGASPQKIEVVPHGLSETIAECKEMKDTGVSENFTAELSRGKPYIVYVSATYGYKNHDRLIRAFSQ